MLTTRVIYSGPPLAEAATDASAGDLDLDDAPDPSVSGSYLKFLQDELVGVDVRLKKDHARVGTVVAVTDGGTHGVAMKVRSGDVEVELPASSLEAVPATDTNTESVPVTDEGNVSAPEKDDEEASEASA